jgi:hypothetical protein
MKRDLPLWIANLLGPLVWFALLSIGYYVVPPAHETARAGTLHLIHVVALVLILISLAIGVRELKRGAGDMADVTVQRRRFLAMSAIGMSALSFLIAAGMLLTTLLLSPGAEP